MAFRRMFRRLRGEPRGRPRRKIEVSIGVLAGSSPFALAAVSHARNPVLTAADVSDLSAGIVADPFMVRRDDLWYMFFEAFDTDTKRGVISVATSEDGVLWAYDRAVLREPFHLSYPYVFLSAGRYYMIPETGEALGVRLYEATDFPYRWSLRKTLLEGAPFVDASVFEYDKRWWMFSETSGGGHSTLRLYHSSELMGQWIEHCRSPIVRDDAAIARPAGRVIVMDDRPIRFAQDCSTIYGRCVNAFEITRLDTKEYNDRLLATGPVIAGSGRGWNSRGMHHIDAHKVENGRWLACVDGFRKRILDNSVAEV